jgi:hypothetical protein
MEKHPPVTDKQAAAIILRLIKLREDEFGPATRLQLSELTLKTIWIRFQLTPEFVQGVQEWLGRAGWTLFYTPRSYALIRSDVIRKWGRLSSKRLGLELAAIRRGQFDFDGIEDQFGADQHDTDQHETS